MQIVLTRDQPVAHGIQPAIGALLGKSRRQTVDGLDQRRRLARSGKQRRHVAIALVLCRTECFVTGMNQAQQGANALQSLAAFVQSLFRPAACRIQMLQRLADFLGKDAPDLAGQRQARVDAKAHAAISGIPPRASDAL
ncbi:hypothetical protein MesoLj113b_08310 [Mesorhizobium sp. 113-3-3]|nr:hypothetical protein MesoLj113b_08310 [Mesorhizobium sp. 113-3-3]